MNRRRITMVMAVALLAISCSGPSKMAYLKDMEDGTEYPASPAPEIKLQAEDRISIRVMAKEPELALPFSDAAASASGGDADCTQLTTMGASISPYSAGSR